MKLFGARRPLVLGHCYEDSQLDAALTEGHLGAVSTVLWECRPDPETRMLRVEVLGDSLAGRGDQVAKVGRDHNDPDLLLAAAQAYIVEARSIPRALKAGATLQLALAPLMTASEQLPDDPVVWALLLVVAQGLDFGRDEQDSIWAEIITRAPTLYPAFMTRLHSLPPEERQQFAMDTLASAPSGDPVTAVVPAAHFLAQSLDSGSAKPWRQALRPATPLITAASRKYLTDTAPHPRAFEAHNIFAAAGTLTNDRPTATTHLHAMRDRLHPWPWSLLDTDPTEAFYRLTAKFTSRA
ncbi:hypothetical protein [Actinocrispum sp. NPDC049592]|uniref:hypothetical protein n=1 Tax=Actinocrispum sp. NPDC049592 TaxID=3154835 RepID=UPI003413F7ED